MATDPSERAAAASPPQSPSVDDGPLDGEASWSEASARTYSPESYSDPASEDRGFDAEKDATDVR